MRKIRFIKILIVYGFILCLSCNHHEETTSNSYSIAATKKRGKFEPSNGKVILFVGQELESIGGTDQYRNGYFDHYPAPGGFTQYTSFLPGFQSFGHSYQGLDGLSAMSNWGDGPENMSLTVADPDFKYSCLAIGLDISQGHDSITAAGGHDTLIFALAKWIKRLNDRPVFLRIGYEFDGFDWNHYRKEYYIPAFRRIKTKMDSMGVKNVAYVWQSKGAGATRNVMDAFYPGDDYVDWVAFSYFIPADSSNPMIQFARDHHKPLFGAESSPVFLDEHGVCKPLDLSKDADAAWSWKDWFKPYFRTIRKNDDVIKAIHYINSPWKTRPMWKDNIYFKNIDARITRNDSLRSWWLEETNKDMYLKSSDTLFRYLSQEN